MKILFITHEYPNYVPDLLLHGLRMLFGPDVVDYPRKDCLYKGVIGLGVCPEDQLCSNLFPNDDGNVDRDDIWSKLFKGYFRFVVFDLRAWRILGPHLDKYTGPLAIIDGEDHAQKIAPGPHIVFRRETDGTDYSIPLPMALPELIFNWIARYDNLPKRHTIGFLGSTADGERKRLIEQLARWYPDTMFEATVVPTQENPEPQGRMGRDAYYQALQQCHFVLNLPGAGWDTFRYWENAACNSVHISADMPIFIPQDFKRDRHIIRFGNPEELRRNLDRMIDHTDRTAEMIHAGRHHLLQFHLTTHRATYFIDKMGAAFD